MHDGKLPHSGHAKWATVILAHVTAIILIAHLLGCGPKIHQMVFGHLPGHAAERTPPP